MVAATLDNTIGALLVGLILSLVLYGVSCAQVWHYYISYPKDKLVLKLLVGGVMLSDTGNLVLICIATYSYLITHFGDIAHLNVVNTPIVAQVLFNGITAVLVQIFFTWRIYRLSHKNLWLTGSIAFMILVQWACNIGYSIVTLQVEFFAQTKKEWTAALDLSQAALDVVIAACMVWLLWGSKTEFTKTNGMIDKLIVFTVNTGLVTSVCAVIAIIMYYAFPNTLIYVAVYINVGRLYCNSLFATLNARNYIRGNGDSGVTYSLDRIHNAGTNVSNLNVFNGSNRAHDPTGISVQIETFKEHTDTRSSQEVARKHYDMA